MTDHEKIAEKIAQASSSNEREYLSLKSAIASALSSAYEAGKQAAKDEEEQAYERDLRQLRNPKAEPPHEYKPHPKYPWFCDVCGYAPHEPLKHVQAIAAAIRSPSNGS